MFSRNLASIIEKYEVINIGRIDKSIFSVIVVLGCNRYSNAPEFLNNDTVSACTLVRLRYAAVLQNMTNLPIIVSGGRVFDESVSESEMMRDVLINEFNSNVFLIEDISQNTMENAKEVAKLLEKNNIKQVLLVTHAIHMLRAEYSFNKYDVDIFPAPTYFYSTKDNKALYFDFLPSIASFYISNMTLYEMIGYIWYQF